VNFLLDEKKLKEVESKIRYYLREGVVQTKQKSEFVDFFLANADKSLNCASALYDLSIDKEMQKKTGYFNFDGFLWVVNSSYYSMFYMARALLENEGIKLKSELSVHALAFDSVIYYFYLNGKLQKRLIDDFAEAKKEVSEILGKQKADRLIEDYHYEKGKRATFTYKINEIVLKAKAKTSFDRAAYFSQEIKKIIEQK